MLIGTIFISGAYGVGKNTIAKELSRYLSVPNYSASTLISQINGENYVKTKVVTDKYNNQDILAIRVKKMLNEYSRIILTGHFCIVNKLVTIQLPTL